VAGKDGRAPFILITFLLTIVSACLVYDGGFGAATQTILACASGLVLVAATLLDPSGIRNALNLPVAALLGLTLLNAASLLWADVTLEDSARVALTSSTYAAMAISACVLAQFTGVRFFVTRWVAIVAIASALVGLYAVAFESVRWAGLIDGQWRASGFPGYPPALAYLQLAGMTVLAREALSGVLRLPAAGGLVLSAGSLLLTQSRMGLLLAVIMLGFWIYKPRALIGSGRRQATQLSLLAIAGGTLVAASIRIPDLPAFKLAAAALVIAVAMLLFGSVSRRDPDRSKAPLRLPRARTGAVVFLTTVAVFVGLAQSHFGSSTSDGRQAKQGVDHGRIGIWSDSIESISEAPLLGHGAGSFYVVTRGAQESPVRFAHNQVVEATVESGIFGGALILVLAFGVASAVYRRRNRTVAGVLLPAVLLFPVFWSFDWTWHLMAVGSVWAISLGVLSSVTPGPDERG
jgi:hypothetical protein